MEKGTRILLILVLLLIPCIGSMLRITADSNIRSVDFVIILATGAVTGLLVRQLITVIKNKRQSK
jgi:hypothetical protein